MVDNLPPIPDGYELVPKEDSVQGKAWEAHGLLTACCTARSEPGRSMRSLWWDEHQCRTSALVSRTPPWK